jgi:lysophospholipid acyltransferase (LPLAT)-like uncharacterized protein
LFLRFLSAVFLIIMAPMFVPNSLRRFVYAYVGRPLFWLWFKTCRWTVVGDEEYWRLRRAGKPVILVMWHGRIFIVPYFFRRRGIMPLVSPSRDGEIPAVMMDHWGYKVLRGSGSHAVVQEWKTMVRELRAGGEVMVVADGPRGPDRILKEGCLRLARETGAAVVPWTFSAARRKRLRSWDRFLMFPPFTRVVAFYGQPFTVDPGLRGEDLELERQRVEVELTAFDALADGFFRPRSG